MTFHVVGVDGEVAHGEVRIASHHLFGLPAGELLQSKQRRAVLQVLTRPGVPQVMPADDLRAQDAHCRTVERHCDCFPSLCLVGMNPCEPPLQIDLVPTQSSYI